MDLTVKNIVKGSEYLCHRANKSNVYEMSDNTGRIVGRMVAYPEFIKDSDTYYPDKKDYYSLYIKRLFVEKEFRHKGIGKYFLDIAATDSYKRNCDGNVHLIAERLEAGNPPQKFYRKNGFDSQNKTHIDLIDKAIETNTSLPPARWITPMFLPKKK